MPVIQQRWDPDTKSSYPVVLFEGAVLATGERNYYDDSDFYAVVWDEERNAVRSVEYATTRSYTGGNSATRDCTPKNARKAAIYLGREYRREAHSREVSDSQVPYVGRPVRVVSARGGAAKHNGTVGWVSWRGEVRRHRYDNWPATRVGIRPGCLCHQKEVDQIFVGQETVEVINPAQYVASDSEIRRRAHNVMLGIINKPSVARIVRASIYYRPGMAVPV